MMDTEIRFLRDLEEDLLEVAATDSARIASRAHDRRRMRRRSWLGAVAGFLLLAFAIGALANSGQGGQLAQHRAAAAFSTVGSAVNGGGGVPHAQVPRAAHDLNGSGSSRSQPSPRPTDLSKIERDGTMSLTIPDGSFEDRFRRAIRIATANGGSVLSSQTQGPAAGSLTLRIPATRFDRALGQLRTLGDVASSTVTGRDVTARFIDYRAHLEILASRRTVLLRLMDQATTMGQTIAVENVLNDVELQIDQIEGQLRFLDNQVAESTIEVDLQERHAAPATAIAAGVHNPSLHRALDRAVQGFLAVLATVIVGLGYLVPVSLLAGIVLVVVTLVRRRGLAAT
jgi:hypothetical protein